jgi:hypothetical protein
MRVWIPDILRDESYLRDSSVYQALIYYFNGSKYIVMFKIRNLRKTKL